MIWLDAHVFCKTGTGIWCGCHQTLALRARVGYARLVQHMLITLVAAIRHITVSLWIDLSGINGMADKIITTIKPNRRALSSAKKKKKIMLPETLVVLTEVEKLFVADQRLKSGTLGKWWVLLNKCLGHHLRQYYNLTVIYTLWIKHTCLLWKVRNIVVWTEAHTLSINTVLIKNTCRRRVSSGQHSLMGNNTWLMISNACW